MDTVKLTVHEREETGNGPARRLRAKGLVPAVSYAQGKEATPKIDGLVNSRYPVARFPRASENHEGPRGGSQGKRGAPIALRKRLMFC